MTRQWWLATLVLFAAIGVACDSDDDDDAGDDAAVDDDVTDDDITDDDSGDDDTGPPPCDGALRPIVFVHGFIDSGGTFALPAMRFASNGYCADRIFTFDWNTLGSGYDLHRQALTAFVDMVLQITGATQVDLIGHSAGSGLCVSWINEGANAAKVAHYAHLAGFAADGPPGGVPTLTLSSADDPVAGPSDIPGATNVKLVGTDHLQVVTSAESFHELFRFFQDGREPETTNVAPEEAITLAGRVVALGENTPGAGYAVDVYEVDGSTGARLTGTPAATFTADAAGYFGPFTATPGAYYEYHCVPNDPDLIPVHYYREPSPRTSLLVYIRTFPGAGSLVGLLLRTIEYADDHAVLVAFTADQSVITGRDALTVDGFDLATPEIADAADSTIAIFFFDADGDGVTDATPVGGLFGSFPFLAGFDEYIASAPTRTIPLTFNGHSMGVPNLRSRTDGVAIAVFD
jgi:pimeloyl-ACP methyl ester carboxylesterase